MDHDCCLFEDLSTWYWASALPFTSVMKPGVAPDIVVQTVLARWHELATALCEIGRSECKVISFSTRSVRSTPTCHQQRRDCHEHACRQLFECCASKIMGGDAHVWAWLNFTRKTAVPSCGIWSHNPGREDNLTSLMCFSPSSSCFVAPSLTSLRTVR